MRRHTAQPFGAGSPPRPVLQEPLIGADAMGAPPCLDTDVNLPLVGPAHLVGAAGDGQGPERMSETPNVIVTDMQLPTFDFQLRLPEFDFGEF